MNNKEFKVSYISLGCAKNQVDLEYLIGNLSNSTFQIETNPENCDAVIINTCGFIESAVKEAIDNILLMAKTIPDHAKLIVTGCMAERYKNDILKEIPEIDFVSGVGKLEEVADYLCNITNTKEKGTGRVITNYPYYAYLKISEGCSSNCSFCTIPSIRGSLKSRQEDDILQEASDLVAKGVKELIVISQDTTKYGKDIGNTNILQIMKKLTSSFPETFFRLLYLNPEGVTEEIVKFIAETKNMVKYFEIPVQHASDKILKLMSRRSDSRMINNVFDMIRNIIPDAFIRTTFIVGFPFEDDEDFNILCNFIESKKPDYAGFFPYSKEDGTKAALLDNQVDKKTVNKRIKKLQSIQKKNTIAKLKSIGKKSFLCFAEKENDDFAFIVEGRAIFQAPEIDGKLFITDGVVDNSYGPYKCYINKIAYPDVYVTLEQNNG